MRPLAFGGLEGTLPTRNFETRLVLVLLLSWLPLFSSWGTFGDNGGRGFDFFSVRPARRFASASLSSSYGRVTPFLGPGLQSAPPLVGEGPCHLHGLH